MANPIPNRFTGDATWNDSMATLNDNFDKVVQDVNDIGVKFGGQGTTTVLINPNSPYATLVDITDTRPQYASGNTQIVPRIDAYILNDNDENYRVGTGGLLSSGEAKVMMSCTVAKTPSTGTNVVATFIIQYYNNDSAGHTIYVHIDNSYMNSPQTGVFR